MPQFLDKPTWVSENGQPQTVSSGVYYASLSMNAMTDDHTLSFQTKGLVFWAPQEPWPEDGWQGGPTNPWDILPSMGCDWRIDNEYVMRPATGTFEVVQNNVTTTYFINQIGLLAHEGRPQMKIALYQGNTCLAALDVENAYNGDGYTPFVCGTLTQLDVNFGQYNVKWDSWYIPNSAYDEGRPMPNHAATPR